MTTPTRKQAVEAQASQVQSLLDAEREAVRLSNARDLEALEAAYTDDAMLILPNQPTVSGKPAVRAWLRKLCENREVTFRYENVSAKVPDGGVIGYTVSRYDVTITRSDGSRFAERGRWAQVWHRAGDREWRLMLEAVAADKD